MTTIASNLMASSPNSLYLPTMKKTIVRPWFLPTAETLAMQRKLLSSVFFLVKQGDVFGERLKCTRCQGRHNYITLMCVERPFSGMTGGLYAYYRAVGDNNLLHSLSPAEQARFDAIQDVLAGSMPDLSTKHPLTSNSMKVDLGPSDVQLGAIALGVLEGIASTHAHKLVEKINDRGLKPKLVI